MKLIRDLFTGPTNTHWDLARVSTFLSLVSAIGFQGYAIFEGQTFDPMTFATGCAAILAAGGLSIKLKDEARPKSLRDGETIAD